MGAWITIAHGSSPVTSTWTCGDYANEMINFGQCEADARHHLNVWLSDLGEDAMPADAEHVRRAHDYLTSAGNYPGEYADGETRCVGPWFITVGVDGYLVDQVATRLRAESALRRAEIAARKAGA